MQVMFQVTGRPLGNGDDDTADVHALVIGLTVERLREIMYRVDRLRQLRTQEPKLVEATFEDHVLLFGYDLIEAVEEVTDEDAWGTDSNWVAIPEHLPDTCEYLPTSSMRMRVTLDRDDHEISWLSGRPDHDAEIETRPTTYSELQTAYDIYRLKHPS